MQINSVNNNVSPNFGMALKIDPKAADILKGKSEGYIKKLEQIAEELKDTKHVDLVLNEYAEPIVQTRYAGAYGAPFSPQKPSDEFIYVDTIWKGNEHFQPVNSPHTAVYNIGSQEAALELYNKMKNAHSDVEIATEFTKALEKNLADRMQKAAEEHELKTKINNMVDSLIKKYPKITD